MLVNFTSYDQSAKPRVTIHTDNPLHLSVRSYKNKSADLFLLHEGKAYLVAQSKTLQTKYLFMDGATLSWFYREVISAVRVAEAAGTPQIDIDEMVMRVWDQHQSELAQNAIRADIHFIDKKEYAEEAAKWAATSLSNRKMLIRYQKEKQVLKQLIMKGGTKECENDPERVIIQAVMSIGYIRTCNEQAQNTWNRQAFESWLRDFLCPEDMRSLVRYCSRPEMTTNGHLENLLYILLNRCPPYPLIYITD